MRLREIETRIVRLEQQRPSLTPGIHRYTDEELDGLIAIFRGATEGEAIAPDREAWAIALMRREGVLPCG
ncbi:hypothetical protein [Methylobacterium pseudosasicola]|uniref:Uncharacterized protein n=1 Tax=Methylobacterium pseudosasicola TaxID=582667 RepID=A0A1I4SD38_9HYPH|nr:hypothetical protein [Methylobacterium pseudosasicola]SFM62231.1 hypothetical protein SAMN05192568_104151 [Methylobacterium pseudosasicola]